MKKSLFSVLCALCAISYAGISPNAWAQSNDADEILPPIVFLVLDTSASMNLFFDKDANQTRLTNAMAEIIGGMKLTTDGKLNRAQSGKPFDMPFPTLQNDGKYTPGIKNIPGDSQIAKPSVDDVDASYDESGVIHTYKKVVKFGLAGLAVGSAGSSSTKDSKIKEAAKLSGGQTEGTALRFTLVWGHMKDSNGAHYQACSDLDSHVVINGNMWKRGEHIYYSSKYSKSNNGGFLDVDNLDPEAKNISVKNKEEGKDYAVCINNSNENFETCSSISNENLGKIIGVENIYWKDTSKLTNGDIISYYVQPYTGCRTDHGFQVEIAYINEHGCTVSDTFTYNDTISGGCGNTESCRFPVVTMQYIRTSENTVGYFKILSSGNDLLVGKDNGYNGDTPSKHLSKDSFLYSQDFRNAGEPKYIYGYTDSIQTYGNSSNQIKYGLDLTGLDYKKNLDCTYDKGIWSMQKEADAPLVYPEPSDKEVDITANNERLIQIARTYMGTAATPLGEALADIYYMFGGDSGIGIDQGLTHHFKDGKVVRNDKFNCRGRQKSVILISDGDPNGSGIQDANRKKGDGQPQPEHQYGHSTDIWYDTAHLYEHGIKVFVIGYSNEFDPSKVDPSIENSAAWRLSKAAWRGGTCRDEHNNIIDPSDAGEAAFNDFVKGYNKDHNKLCFYSAVSKNALRQAIVNAVSESLRGTVSKTPAVTTTSVGYLSSINKGVYQNGFSNIYSGYTVEFGNRRETLLERSTFVCNPDEAKFVEKSNKEYVSNISQRLDCDIIKCNTSDADNRTGKAHPSNPCALNGDENTCMQHRVIFAGDYYEQRDAIYPDNAKLDDKLTDDHRGNTPQYNVHIGTIKGGNRGEDYHFITESTADACKSSLDFNSASATDDARTSNYMITPFECFTDVDCGIDESGKKSYLCVQGRCAESSKVSEISGTKECKTHNDCTNGSVCHNGKCISGIVHECDIRSYIASQRLGVIEYATPVVVEPPNKSYKDAAYRLFQNKYWNRDTQLLVGANDGMLHNFIIGKNNDEKYNSGSGLYAIDESITPANKLDRDIAEGDELWGFIPKAIMPKIRQVATSGLSSNVNASPAVLDVRAPDWYTDKYKDLSDPTKSDSAPLRYRTVAVGGFRDGARGYYALDITNPAKPKVLWEIDPTWQIGKDSTSTPSTSKSDFANPPSHITKSQIVDNDARTKTDPDYYPFQLLGKTYAQPIITTALIGNKLEPIAILSGGLSDSIASEKDKQTSTESANDNQIGRVMYVVRIFAEDLLVKTFYFKHEITGEPAVFPNTFGKPVQHIYFGDSKGAVYRINMRGDVANWASQDTATEGKIVYELPAFDPKEFDELKDFNFEQITHKPAVALHHMNGNRAVIQVAIGTGSNDNLNIQPTDHNYVGIFYDVPDPTQNGSVYGFNLDNAQTKSKLILFNLNKEQDDWTDIQTIKSKADRKHDKVQTMRITTHDPVIIQPGEKDVLGDKLDPRQKMTGAPIIYNFDTYFPTYIASEKNPTDTICHYGKAAIYAVRDEKIKHHDALNPNDVQNNEAAKDENLIRFQNGEVSFYKLDMGTKIYGLQITNQLYCGNKNNGKFAAPQLIAQTGIPNGVNGFDKSSADNFASKNTSLNAFGLNLAGIQAQSNRIKWASVYE